MQSLRLHQWAKNILVFVPLLLGGKIHDGMAWSACFTGFLALGLLASASYLANDLLDRSFDRLHWSKHVRPLANGDLPVSVALFAMALGIAASITIAASIDRSAVQILLIYGAITLAYSFRLKRVPILDVLILAVLFTLRLYFGSHLADIPTSPWLLVFSMFLFTSLSLAKRYTEVARNGKLGRHRVNGRGYLSEDAPLLFGMGMSTSAGAVLIMVVYLINEAFGATFYNSPLLLWPMPAIMFLWLGRMWLLAGRNQLDDDPIRFAVTDGLSVALGGAMAVTFLCAWIL
jgi:4-hydroxybenzoate polyprenyltransferase